MKRITFCLLILLISGAHAASEGSRAPETILLHPQPLSPSKLLLSYRDYQDIRVDSDHDGKVDLWILKKGHLQVSTRYDHSGKVSFMHFKKVQGRDVIEALYAPKGRGFKLLASGKRSVRLMHGVVPDVCVSSKQDALTQLQQFTGQLSRQSTAVAVEKLFDSNCEDVSYYERGTRALTDVIESSQESESFASCLEGESFKKQFSAEQALAVDSLAAQLRLNLARMARGQNTPQIKILCGTAKEKEQLSGAFKENGEFLLQVPEPSNRISPNAFKKLFLHEFMHQAGTSDDQFIDGALQSCFKEQSGLVSKLATTVVSRSYGVIPKNAQDTANKVADSSDAKIDTTKAQVLMVPVTLDDAKKSVNDGNISSDLDMQNEIASSQPLPAAEQLASSGQETVSEEAVLSASAAQSAPVLRMANEVMGSLSTPAVAAESSAEMSSDIAQGSSSSNSSPSRKIASENSSRVSLPNRNALKADEKVVEQIEVSGPQAGDVSSALTVSAGNARPQQGPARAPARAPASAALPTGGSAVGLAGQDVASGFSVSVASAPKATAGALSSGAALVDQGSRTSRRPASTSGVSGGSGGDSSGRDEVVTFFARGDYSMTKSKLKDQSFIDRLKQNKITIVDLYGNSYGAPRGDVIFLDEGNRFVRQK